MNDNSRSFDRGSNRRPSGLGGLSNIDRQDLSYNDLRAEERDLQLLDQSMASSNRRQKRPGLG
jgi:hypothetical protein